MRALFEIAIKYKYLTKNPFRQLKQITTYKSKPKIIDVNTINKILEYCNKLNNNWFWIAVIHTLYYTGMRRRQLVELQWRDIDFNNMIIKLSAQSSKTKREYIVPMNNVLFADFNNIKKHSCVIKKDNQVFNICLFSNRHKGKKMTCEHVSKIFQKISKNIGAQVSAHMLRHTMATIIAEKHNNIKDLQNLLGHTSINTTMDYIHPNIDGLRKAQDTL